jgi:hypothetical protein
VFIYRHAIRATYTVRKGLNIGESGLRQVIDRDVVALVASYVEPRILYTFPKGTTAGIETISGQVAHGTYRRYGTWHAGRRL